MKRSISFAAAAALASVMLIAGSSLSGAAPSTTSTTTALTLPEWVGAFCTAVAPSAATLQDAANQAESSGTTDDIAALLDSTSALLQTVSDTMVALGAPPIENGDVMVDEYPGGIAQAIAAVDMAAAAVQSGSITSIDQIGSIDVDGGLSPEATQAWDRIEAEMGSTPECQDMQGVLGTSDASTTTTAASEVTSPKYTG